MTTTQEHKHWPSRVLEVFNRWFSSGAGVWQTFIAVAAIVTWETVNPTMDDHGFWLLFWLTVYSAVTQPVLAYGNYRDSVKNDEILARLEEVMSDEFVVDSETHGMVLRIAEKLGIDGST